jgi:DNA-binding NarL/FixJ family response regulator
MSTTVLVADHHGIVRDGLRLALSNEDDLEVIGEATNGREAIELAAQLNPNVVLMEVTMPVLNGIEAARRILKANRQIKVLALSGNCEGHLVKEMLKAGASGYVLKKCATDELIKAIKTIMNGGRYLSSDVAGVVIDDLVGYNGKGANHASVKILTPKERELLQMLSEGDVSKVAAKKLHVSVKTIDARRRDIMKKLNLDSIALLTKFAIREGLTSLNF